ncbi:hypothetical protein HK099_003630 [Clydaea vesicula]|uniref:Uncharacterized protein n=1 Tax=Clydaea vesicula TaxID=447962 RepID=A0AAD5XYR9_9FUNG|nr:hypothetical protein HK099_003630 [Clydaea vesicula]
MIIYSIINLISLSALTLATLTSCPLKGSCPYYSEHHAKTEELHQSVHCPLKNGNCPYYNKHKSDESLNELLVNEDHKCPISSKCSFYNDLKNGVDVQVNWKNEKCPISKSCPYYAHLKDGEAYLSECPVLHKCPQLYKETRNNSHHVHGDPNKCPHLKSQKPSKEDEDLTLKKTKLPHHHQRMHSEEVKLGGCPLEGSCPWYSAHKSSHHETVTQGCPASNCPYYDKHKRDSTVDELLTEDHHECPLHEKCNILRRKKINVDWSNSNCPLNEKCPYYQKLKGKENDLTHCPVISNCPHFAKEMHQKKEPASNSGCPLNGACPWYKEHKESHKYDNKEGCLLSDKCPYYKKHKEDATVEDLMTEKQHECPLHNKCPLYKAHKEGNESEIDWNGTNCPLNEKWFVNPYYKKVKKTDKHDHCPLLQNCPHYSKSSDSKKKLNVTREKVIIDSSFSASDVKGGSSTCPHLKYQKGDRKVFVENEIPLGDHPKAGNDILKCPHMRKKLEKVKNEEEDAIEIIEEVVENIFEEVEHDEL